MTPRRPCPPETSNGLRMIVHMVYHTVGMLLGLMLAFFGGAQAQEKPNIVIFLAEDHGQEDAGCYGNRVVKTPVIDQLARDGMVFNRAFSLVSRCDPSPSRPFTCLYQHQHGLARNIEAVQPDV